MHEAIKQAITKKFETKSWVANRADPTAVESYKGHFNIGRLGLDIEVTVCWDVEVEISLFYFEAACFAKGNLHFGNEIHSWRFYGTKFTEWLNDILREAFSEDWPDYEDFSIQI